MRIFRFDPQVGRSIDQFGSSNLVLSNIVSTAQQARISCMHLGPQGLVGYHQAASPQLFLVVHGEGWVRGERPDRLPITAGRAAFWEKGEWHEAGTDAGLVAIVIESETLAPGQFMSEQ